MQALGRAVAVITLGTAAIQILVWGGDAYAQWILKVSGRRATGGYAIAGVRGEHHPALALIFGLLGVIAVGLQWVIMFVRQALMLLLNAFWQIVAAYALLQPGEQAFEKITAWIIAFIIYMPLAASIYAFAWRLKNGQDGVGGVLYGLMLIVLAVIALPAIMRLLIPASAAIGSAVGGAMAMGVAAAARAGRRRSRRGRRDAAARSAGAGAGAGGGETSTTASAGVAEGGEMAAAGGGEGAATTLRRSVAGGGDSDAELEWSGQLGAVPVPAGWSTGSTAARGRRQRRRQPEARQRLGSAGPAHRPPSGASDSGSGQSAGVAGRLGGGRSAADGVGDAANTAEGMIGE